MALLVLAVPAEAAAKEWTDWKVAQVLPWYGPGLYGNGTACGQTLTRHLRGVAHRTLPCGTRVQFRKAGVRITARVVDRGPYPERSMYPAMRWDLTARSMCWDLNGGTYESPCSTKHRVKYRVWR